MDIEIRRADAQDVPALADALAAAFASYPWTRFSVPPQDHESRLRKLYGIYLDLALHFGQLWMTEDRAGVAAWTWSPSMERQWRFMQEQGLDRRVADLVGDRAAATQRADEVLEPYRPQEPHWLLAAVGVRPGRQGLGLGTRLLRPGLDRCDADGTPAALETSSPANVRLYERLGFAVMNEVDLSGGPHVWLMRRSPDPGPPGDQGAG